MADILFWIGLCIIGSILFGIWWYLKYSKLAFYELEAAFRRIRIGYTTADFIGFDIEFIKHISNVVTWDDLEDIISRIETEIKFVQWITLDAAKIIYPQMVAIIEEEQTQCVAILKKRIGVIRYAQKLKVTEQ